MHQLLENTSDLRTHTDLIRRAGAWLDRFHRAGSPHHAPFHAAHTARYFQSIRAELAAGTRAVAHQDRFCRGVDHVAAKAQNTDTKETVFAHQHGAYRPSRLICDDNTTLAFDIGGPNVMPVAHDIAHFLLDYTLSLRGLSGLGPGSAVHEDAFEAFFEGYRLITPDDPSLEVITLSKPLNIWLGLPAAASDAHARSASARRLFALATGLYPEIRKQAPMQILLRTSPRNTGAPHPIHAPLSAIPNLAVTDKAPSSSLPALSLVEGEAPLTEQGLCVHQAYGGPFWFIERHRQPWLWDVAGTSYMPTDLPDAKVHGFADLWRSLLHGRPAPRREGFIYMPLQGFLLKRRGFQSASPVQMIEQTLKASVLPILATLDPGRTYAPQALRTLEDLQDRHPRFRLVDLPMAAGLESCDLVVCQNDPAGFHAGFFGKPCVLFARAAFHHIAFNVSRLGVEEAISQARTAKVEFDRYLYWFWQEKAINLDAVGASDALRQRLIQLGWPL